MLNNSRGMKSNIAIILLKRHYAWSLVCPSQRANRSVYFRECGHNDQNLFELYGVSMLEDQVIALADEIACP
ncbi:hypothetical protein Droror1_Dr00009529 [Drosera rotundifolia]